MTINGNLNSNDVSVSYNGVTYKKSLKMESKTTITFTTSKALKLIIVTDTASKKIKVDGTNETTDSNKVVEVEIAAGSHTITKGDTMNVVAIIFQE